MGGVKYQLMSHRRILSGGEIYELILKWFPRFGEGKGVNRQSKEDFEDSENTSFDTINGGIMSLHICPNPKNVHQE